MPKNLRNTVVVAILCTSNGLVLWLSLSYANIHGSKLPIHPCGQPAEISESTVRLAENHAQLL